ncbi:aldehyde dehydrogenase family protein [Methanolobus sp. ZRKC3]|uniref:aldehyde dehydrogenase family protein n=1 Tax=Methanolobus sp. ZRKC3 TaxID=3125786 RepID=UPI00324E60EF
MNRDIQRVFKLQQEHAPELARMGPSERIERLLRIDKYLKDENRVTELCDAMQKDFRKHEVEVIATEIGVVQAQISHTRKKLRSWMRSQKVKTPLPMVGTRSYIRYEPKGVVLIMAPWNYPFNLSLVPLVYAIASGNAAIIKPSEVSANTSAFIKKMINELFDESEVAVFEGGPSVAQELLDQPFNHIFFTGSPQVGRIVMTAAAKHLASVTLELGGKSPAIVDKTANVRKAARGAAWSKLMNNGQTCITPDYLILHDSISDSFIDEFNGAVQEFYDPDGKGIENSPDYCRIINDFHFQRLKSLYDDAIAKGARVRVGADFKESERFISPTLIDNVSDDMNIMQEEIFGPMLPVVTFSQRSEVRDIIRKRPKPLTLYISSHDRENVDYFMGETSAGGTVINDYMLGYSNPYLPFGGVNDSGIGKSIGVHAFKAFSNERSVIRRKWGTLSMLYPPYTNRVKILIQTLYRWM